MQQDQRFVKHSIAELLTAAIPTVPIRGTVHDIGPAVSHKAEVIRRFLRGQSPADLARELHHAQHAVHRYLKDYEVTRTLVQKFPLHEIPALAKHALSLVREHVQLIREYEPNLVFYSPEPTAAG
jgi:predicted transcriptional regulator